MPSRVIDVRGRYSPTIELDGREPTVNVLGRYATIIDVTGTYKPTIEVFGREDNP